MLPGSIGEHGMDAAQPLGPGAAQQFVQHRLRLVVQGVRGGHRVRLPVRHQLPEKGVAKVAGGLLQGLMQGCRGRGSIRAMQMEWQVMGCGQAGNKCRVFVGGSSTNAVVHVDHGKHDAQRVPFLEQAAQQGHGIGAAGDRDGNPLAGMKETAAESGRGGLHR